jgi:hypothetical protein
VTIIAGDGEHLAPANHWNNFEYMMPHHTDHTGRWPACRAADMRPIAREVKWGILKAGVSAHEITAPRTRPWSKSAPVWSAAGGDSMAPVMTGVTHAVRTIPTDMMFDVVTVHAVTRLCIRNWGTQYEGNNGKCGDKQSHWDSGSLWGKKASLAGFAIASTGNFSPICRDLCCANRTIFCRANVTVPARRTSHRRIKSPFTAFFFVPGTSRLTEC